MSKHKPPLTPGQKFGEWTVGAEVRGAYGRRKWICKCSCGTENTLYKHHLLDESSTSCGCKTPMLISVAKTRHGHARGNSPSPTWGSWSAMRGRCESKTDPAWDDYGGRGITVCDRWNSFENFLADMGERPTDTTIDRIDVNGGYSKENCKWSTNLEQQNNRRVTVRLTIDGVTKSLTQWARDAGLTRGALRQRYAAGGSSKTPPASILRPARRMGHA